METKEKKAKPVAKGRPKRSPITLEVSGDQVTIKMDKTALLKLLVLG